jgi:ERCC4-type nuclease
MTITIVVDTREQLPLSFDPANVLTVRAALPAGDYSILGAEDRVAIERKSLADLVRSFTAARARFMAELRVLSTYEWAAVVVEDGWPNLLAGRYPGTVKPASVAAAVVSTMVDLKVPVLFAGDRPGARRMVEDLLVRWERRKGA